MAIAYTQALFTANSKTAGTSLALTGSKTVTLGNHIFVAFASDDVGSAFGVTDNLLNTYSQVGSTKVETGAVKSQLWSAPITTGGTLTTITVSWTTNITAKAAAAAEYSGLGSHYAGSPYPGQSWPAGSSTGVECCINGSTRPDPSAGALLIGVGGSEGPTSDSRSGTVGGTPTPPAATASLDGTTGQGATSNICVALVHVILTADTTDASVGYSYGTTRAGAAMGAVYLPASAPAPIPKDYYTRSTLLRM